MNNQQPLPLITDLESATAQQLAWERNRDTPSEKDLADAVVMSARWNLQRVEMGLKAWQ
jgi:hypothetical protein